MMKCFIENVYISPNFNLNGKNKLDYKDPTMCKENICNLILMMILLDLYQGTSA